MRPLIGSRRTKRSGRMRPVPVEGKETTRKERAERASHQYKCSLITNRTEPDRTHRPLPLVITCCQLFNRTGAAYTLFQLEAGVGASSLPLAIIRTVRVSTRKRLLRPCTFLYREYWKLLETRASPDFVCSLFLVSSFCNVSIRNKVHPITLCMCSEPFTRQPIGCIGQVHFFDKLLSTYTGQASSV